MIIFPINKHDLHFERTGIECRHVLNQFKYSCAVYPNVSLSEDCVIDFVLIRRDGYVICGEVLKGGDCHGDDNEGKWKSLLPAVNSDSAEYMRYSSKVSFNLSSPFFPNEEDQTIEIDNPISAIKNKSKKLIEATGGLLKQENVFEVVLPADYSRIIENTIVLGERDLSVFPESRLDEGVAYGINDSIDDLLKDRAGQGPSGEVDLENVKQYLKDHAGLEATNVILVQFAMGTPPEEFKDQSVDQFLDKMRFSPSRKEKHQRAYKHLEVSLGSIRDYLRERSQALSGERKAPAWVKQGIDRAFSEIFSKEDSD